MIENESAWRVANMEIEEKRRIIRHRESEIEMLRAKLAIAVEALDNVRNGMIKIKDATTTGYRQIIDQALANIRGEHE